MSSQLLNSDDVSLILKDLSWSDVKTLSERLGVPDAALSTIEEENSTLDQRISKAMRTWIESDAEASWPKVISALGALKHYALATSLEVGKISVRKDAVSLSRTKICRLSTADEFHERMLNDIKMGMERRPRWIPSKYRYDEEGSALFESIIQRPEYYVNRVETEILSDHAEEILKLTNPDEIIELGSGSSKKTRALIEAMHLTSCRRYVPIDISESALQEAADILNADYDWLEVEGHIADYDHDLPRIRRKGRRLFAMFGTTVGNYISRQECTKFLEKMRASMNEGDALLVGIDLLKDVSLLTSAYNDVGGANAKFKIRVLEILNREVDSNFVVQDFEYFVRWNTEKSAMESMLRARKDMAVSIRALQMEVRFSKGDEIIVGISCKFTPEEFKEMLTGVGFEVPASYTDSGGRYGVFVASAV